MIKTVGMWVLMLGFNDQSANYYPWEKYVRYTPTFGKYNSYDVSFIDRTIEKADSLKVDYLILDNANGVFRNNGPFDRVVEAYITQTTEKNLI